MVGTESQIRYAKSIASDLLGNITWLESTYGIKTDFVEVRRTLVSENANEIIETLSDWEFNFPYGLASKEQSMRAEKKSLEMYGKHYDELNAKEEQGVLKCVQFYSDFYSVLSEAERKLGKKEWEEREKAQKTVDRG